MSHLHMTPELGERKSADLHHIYGDDYDNVLKKQGSVYAEQVDPPYLKQLWNPDPVNKMMRHEMQEHVAGAGGTYYDEDRELAVNAAVESAVLSSSGGSSANQMNMKNAIMIWAIVLVSLVLIDMFLLKR